MHLHWAAPAGWRCSRAKQCPQFHNCLIPGPALPGRHSIARNYQQPRLTSWRRFLWADEQALHHSPDVRIHKGDILLECEAGDRTCSVRPNPRQLQQPRQVTWELTTVLIENSLCRTLQIDRPAIISQSSPGADHL